MMKKCNIQKSVSWCEKLKIPCNKFSEKTNIFLPIINDHKVLEEGVEEDVEDVNVVMEDIEVIETIKDI